MRVAKWGNGLAVRLPAALVAELGLRAGDDVEVTPHTKRKLKIARDPRREEALARIMSVCAPLPPGYKFDREEAHERGPE